MKTIAVIGANGRSGKAFVNAALAAGYHVKAGVHSGNMESRNNLETLKVDATNLAQTKKLLTGSDIVVSLLGHVKGSPARIQTESMKTIVRAMHESGVSRIISLTGSAVRFPGDKPSVFDYALNIPLKFIDPNRINDGIAHAEVLKQSDVSWTILRVLKLTSGKTSPFRLTTSGPAKLFTSRRNVAAAILEIIDDDTYQCEAPVISNA